ncbi:DUF2239 family protein [Brevundimonas sp.]|uniref:DUF2239 family protein n=1 Tax=Brevundimonas sp. TaxID=1871086 RepID=UPI002FC73CAB
MTQTNTPSPVAAFAGSTLIAAGPLAQVAVQVYAQQAADRPVLVFSDETGRVIDLDLRGTPEDVARHYAVANDVQEAAPKGRGRPKLGVVPREITLLPRHWEWLSSQQGGASQTLRRLVDEARKADGGRTQTKAAQERTYRFVTAVAGDLPDYEEAVRALFASDMTALEQHMAAWPADVRQYALRLLGDRSENDRKD